MTVRELIEKLEEIEKNHGDDLEVTLYHHGSDKLFDYLEDPMIEESVEYVDVEIFEDSNDPFNPDKIYKEVYLKNDKRKRNILPEQLVENMKKRQ